MQESEILGCLDMREAFRLCGFVSQQNKTSNSEYLLLVYCYGGLLVIGPLSQLEKKKEKEKERKQEKNLHLQDLNPDS